MSTDHVERERTYLAPDATGLPELVGVAGITQTETLPGARLDATYYDVPGLRLLRDDVTLRRRTGGSDAGWHLKLPLLGQEGHEEVHLPVQDESEVPPQELTGLVAGWTREVSVAPVARIRTDRTVTRLLGRRGEVLAEVAHDVVEAHAARLDARTAAWQEWEVELVTGEPALLDDLEAVLAEAGLDRSPYERKLAALLEVAPATDAGDDDGLRPDVPARVLVEGYVRSQVRELAVWDPVARRGGDGAVHAQRKAARRLRAVLATARPVLDRAATDPVRDELRWLARSLGEARDDEVALDRLLCALDEHPDVDDAAVREHLTRWAGERHRLHEERLATLLDSERYLRLRAGLDDLVNDPPWRQRADEPAASVLEARVRREWRRVRRRHESDADPHEVRKAAKRLRCAYEMLEPAWGREARRPRKAARALTQALGERQDSLVARDAARRLAEHADGPLGFALGRLHGLEERQADLAAAEVAQAWSRLERRAWSGGR